MGWFNSALQGIGSAVNWVKQNSGTIAKAAEVIAGIAGVPVMADDVNGPVTDLFPNFTKAAAKVYDKAQKGAQEKLDEVLASLPERIRNDTTLEITQEPVPAESTFLWSEPAPLDTKGQPNKELVQDIGKMLTQRNFPTVLPTSSNGAGNLALGGLLDVALRIGQAIFANLGKAVDSDGDITSTQFVIPSGDDSVTITGCHAFYGIPLGQTGFNSAWHAGLVMHKITTQTYRKFESARIKALSFHEHIRLADPVWLVTLNVAWEDSVWANTLTPKLKTQLEHTDVTKAGWKLHYNSLDGMDQQIKLQCPPDFTPPQAKGLVRQCIKTVAPSSQLALDESSNPYLTPDIQVTLSTLLLPNA